MTILRYIRMHGCGNDYVFIDAFTQPPPAHPDALAHRLSDRHRSVGGDGLVLMLPSTRPDCHARMRMFNADGSEGTLCGNALRCMALWLHHAGRAPRCLTIEMQDRSITAEILTTTSQSTLAGSVRITLPTPQTLAPLLPPPASFTRPTSLPDVHVPGLLYPALEADPGNPHVVFFVRHLSDVPLERLGPVIEHHPAFPNRTNVEFAEQFEPNAFRVRVWERGSAETQACGSGACAVTLAAASIPLIDPRQPVLVQMTGGPLRVHLHTDGSLQLEGPAEECCQGTVHL
ncbi:MAG: diaminopimelate epimerase [Planctomycetota bacterium]